MHRRRLKRRYRIFLGLFLAAVVLGLGCLLVWSRTPETGSWPLAEYPPASDGDFSAESVLPETETNASSAAETAFSRSVWISYLEYESLLTGKSEAEFAENFDALCQTAAGNGFQRLMVQVRAHGDAFYPSALFPWATGVTGRRETDPGFDPLAIMVETAHAHDLLLDAWINPYRLMQKEDLAALTGEYAFVSWVGEKDVLVEKDGCYWMNPAKEEVRTLITQGAEEILSGYAVDGLQLDDYFYAVTPTEFGLSEEEAREALTLLVQSLSVLCRQREVRFSVSPAGNFTDAPVSDDTQYTSLTAWCDAGLLDAVIPQIYWDFADDRAPFATVLGRWTQWAAEHSVSLEVGLAAYKFDAETLARQEAAVAAQGLSGAAYFRYDFLDFQALAAAGETS